jgi:ribonuclease P protein component
MAENEARRPVLRKREASVQVSAAAEGTCKVSFPKRSRLLKRADFDRVYKSGKRHFGAHLTAFFLPRSAGAPRIGLAVGRALGGAVVRNRIKRRLREAVRLNLHVLASPVDMVINPKKAALTAGFDELSKEVQKALAAAGRQSTPPTRRQEQP